MKTFIVLFVTALLTSCVAEVSSTTQVHVRQLRCGEKVSFYTCTGNRCYVLTEPMEPGYVPKTYKLYNEDRLGSHFEEFRECQ